MMNMLARQMGLLRPFLASLVLASAVGGCARNPVTGQLQLALVSEAQEIQMGQQASQQIEASIGLVPDEALQSYFHAIGARMAATSERPHLPWRFRVVDDPTPNAFALPGGFIYVTRGLLALMNSEAELASVIGHEIGHVTARHSVDMISRAQLAQIGLGLGMIFFPGLEPFGGLAGAGMELLFLRYGRDAEHQADELGFGYALEQGYDVRQMANVFATLQRVGEAEGQSPLPSWASTHPNPGDRIQRTQERAAALEQPEALRLGLPEFNARIENIVYGPNPRHGIFQGAVFLHPDLRFRMEFPQGWRTQNLPQAVIGVSPQQDAAIQLSLTAGTPDQAAQAFFRQQGVAAGQTTRETINGNPAIVSLFQAQTQQGVVQGYIAFISYGGRTYQLLGYSPQARFATYDRPFRAVIGSFAQLTDPQVLAIQPNRLRVVRTDQAMTLSAFNQRFPSVVPIAQLAIINGVADGNALLPAGAFVKRVVAG
jgi:predicted Zn-dependent protease